MSYTPVTPAQFKTAKPQFAAVADATVQLYLDMAGVLAADDSWPSQEVYEFAVIAFTCHLMTIGGLGTDPVSKEFAAGKSGYQTIKSGDLTLTKYARAARNESEFSAWLGQTSCGQFYGMLLKTYKPGPVAIVTSRGRRVSPYAKDWFR